MAQTPPMGWNSWNRFGCNLSEKLVREMADAMVSSGMKAVGYQYVNLDDCWQVSRTDNGQIVADPALFPSGMKNLADYVHQKGLKFGLYSSRGTTTCAGRPGSFGYETQDAQTYAAWGVDYLKYDNCAAVGDQQTDYARMGDALARSGRGIVYSICAWEFFDWMPLMGHLWRTTHDIRDQWDQVCSIIDTNVKLAAFARPGAWNDPDMLEVGVGGLSEDEDRAHFSLWAMMAAPLIAGADLRSMSAATREILTNPEVIAVDQDPLGVQGVVVRDDGDLEVWSKPLQGSGTRAVVLFNRSSTSATIGFSFAELGLDSPRAWVRDLWARSHLGWFTSTYQAEVPPHGAVMLRVSGAVGSR